MSPFLNYPSPECATPKAPTTGSRRFGILAASCALFALIALEVGEMLSRGAFGGVLIVGAVLMAASLGLGICGIFRDGRRRFAIVTTIIMILALGLALFIVPHLGDDD